MGISKDVNTSIPCFPLIVLYNDFKNKLYEELSNIPLINISLNDTLSKRISDKVHPFLINEFYIQAIQYEYQVGREGIADSYMATQGIDASALSFFANSHLNDKKYTAVFYKKYPVLKKKTAVFHGNIIKYVVEIIRHIDCDYTSISEKFKNINSDICDIELFKGDLHNGNKSTAFIVFGDEAKLIYKPHSLIADKSFYNILLKFCPFEIPTYNILCMDDYGYTEYISSTHNLTNSQAQSYFYKFGFIAYIIDILGTSDIIHDNVLPHKDGPVFIDVESIVNQRLLPRLNNKISNYSQNNSFIYNSIIAASIIPSVFDVDGLLDYQSPLLRSKGAIKDHLTDRESEKLTVPHYLHDHHLPYVEGKRVDINDGYLGSFEKGFSDAYTQISPEKIVNSIDNEMPFRILLRDTSDYMRLLKESNKPYYLTSLTNQKLLFKKLSAVSNRRRRTTRSEIIRLSQYDIPFFYSRVYDNRIFSIDIKLAPRVSKINNKNARTYLCRKAEQIMSQRDSYLINMQKVHGFAFHLSRPTISELYHFIIHRDAATKVSQIDLQGFTARLIGLLTKYQLTWDNSHYFLGLGSTYDGAFNIQTLKDGLYNGVSGIALFLLFSFNEYKGEEVGKMFYTMHDQLKESSLNTMESSISEISLFEAPSSFMYLHVVAYKLLGLKLDRNFIGLWQNWVISNFDRDKLFDVLTGISGIVNFVLSNLKIFSIDFTETLVNIYWQKCLELKRMDNSSGCSFWNPVKEFNGQVGMAHGSAGYLYTLVNIYDYTKNEEILATVHSSFMYFSKLYHVNKSSGYATFDRKGESMVTTGWNHGATGAFFSLLKIYQAIPREITPKIEDILCDTYAYITENIVKKNYTLANGVCGNLIALKFGFNVIKKIRSSLAFSAENILSDIEVIDLFNGTEFDKTFLHSTLFTGISGVGYSLLYVYGNEKSLPNILNFE